MTIKASSTLIGGLPLSNTTREPMSVALKADWISKGAMPNSIVRYALVHKA